MRLVRRTRTRLLFQLGKRDAGWLLTILKLYPRVPPAHHVLSRAGNVPDKDDNQRLLNEALAEQRNENKRHLLALLADPRRFTHNEAGARLSLPLAEVEWMMQVLNDIRVGSWLVLGAPETGRPELNETTAPDLFAMEVAGYFQAQLLEAVHGET